jgi:hypothetical protein
MKNYMLICAGAVAVVALAATSVMAQVTGCLHSAKPLSPGSTDFGGYIGLFDGAGYSGTPLAVFGQLRHGLTATGDGGLKFGLVDMDAGDDDIGIVLAGDAQWALLAPRWGDPFWLSVGPEISVYDGDGTRTWAFGGNLTASHDLLIRANTVTIYGRFNLRLETLDFKKSGRSSDSDLEMGLNPGFIWKTSGFFDLVGEIQFDDQVGVLVGFNFRM